MDDAFRAAMQRRASGQITCCRSELFWTSFHALMAEQFSSVETSTFMDFARSMARM